MDASELSSNAFLLRACISGHVSATYRIPWISKRLNCDVGIKSLSIFGPTRTIASVLKEFTYHQYRWLTTLRLSGSSTNPPTVAFPHDLSCKSLKNLQIENYKYQAYMTKCVNCNVKCCKRCTYYT